MRDKNKIKIEHVNADINPSDLLTKIHSDTRFNKLIKLTNPIRLNEIQVQEQVQDQSEEEEDPTEENGEHQISNSNLDGKHEVNSSVIDGRNDYNICLAWINGNGSCDTYPIFEENGTV